MKLKLGAVLAIAFCALATAAFAGPTKIKNGDFEDGSFHGWKRHHTEGGRWLLASSMDTKLGPTAEPINGDYSAYTFQIDPASEFLYRKLELDGDYRNKLKFKYDYDNYDTAFHTPGDFKISHRNQQFRVDVIKPSAKLNSLENDDVLANVVRTRKGDPLQQAPRTASVNLSELGSKTVILRFAVAATDSPLVAVVDDVRVKSEKRK